MHPVSPSYVYYFFCPQLILCFSFPAEVTSERNKTAVSGKKASLSCSFGLPEKVQQILWKHTPAQGESTEVASFAKRSDPMIEPAYQGRVWLSASLSDSELTIQPVAIQDEGCYTCFYETHTEGTKSSVVCLSTYGKYLLFKFAFTHRHNHFNNATLGQNICFPIFYQVPRTEK